MNTTDHRRYILVVDDEEEDRYFIDLSFKILQWDEHVQLLNSADSVFRYLNALTNPGAYPALILLDMS